MNNPTRNTFPALRCYLGDWVYYITYMRFADINQWIKPTSEVHQNKALRDMIQRQLTDRSSDIATYLIEQNERFFNAIVVGVYGGAPQWYPIEIGDNPRNGSLTLDKDLRDSIGILRFDGEEKLFAIDGQHRVEGIKQALDRLDRDANLGNDELAVIFVAHDTDETGITRTRRLFSTLNRHAVPVSKGEIVSLDEDDAFAIVTRRLVENYPPLKLDLEKEKGFVRFAKTTPLPASDTTSLTSILALYDIVKLIHVPLLDNMRRKRMRRLELRRPSDKVLDSIYEEQVTYWNLLREYIPEYDTLFRSSPEAMVVANFRTDQGGHLMFRPAGQKAFSSALRVLLDRGWVMRDGVARLARTPMELNEAPWQYVLWLPSQSRINTKVSPLLPESILLYFVGEKPRKKGYSLMEEYRKILGDPMAMLPAV